MNLSLIDDMLDWRALLRWPWWAKGALLTGCLLLVPALAFGFMGRGLLDSISREGALHDELQQQWRVQSAEVESQAAQQAQVARLQADLLRSHRELFDDDGLASLLQGLGQLGAELSFEQVSVLDPHAGANRIELPLQLQMLGEYRALKRFIAGLAKLGKLVTLHELQLSAAEANEPGTLRLQLRLQAYRVLQPEMVVEQATAAPVEARNPFEVSEAWAAGVAALGLDQARMVGYLQDRFGQAALVSLGDSVHLLREGDHLADARVVLVEEGRIELLLGAEGIAAIPRVLTLGNG